MKMKSLFLGIVLLAAFPAFAQNKATKSLSLVVNPGTVTISTATVPGGEVGFPYTTTIAASGGLSPYIFSVSAGSLPAGLSIASSTGVISGTPSVSGSNTFTVQVADAETPAVTATQSYTLVVVPTLTITTSSLPAANIGVSYSGTLAATGGVTPYTWSVTTGALPAGLTLNPATGAITGTPTAAGTFTFTVTVTDSDTGVAKLEIKAKIEIATTQTKMKGRSS